MAIERRPHRAARRRRAPGSTTSRSTTGSRSPSASCFGWALEFHAAARLASGVFVAAAFWLIYRRRARLDAARRPDARPPARAALSIAARLPRPHRARARGAARARRARRDVRRARRAAATPRTRPVRGGPRVRRRARLRFPLRDLDRAGRARRSPWSPRTSRCPEWRTRARRAFLAVGARRGSSIVGAPGRSRSPLRSPELFARLVALRVAARGRRRCANLRHFLSTSGWFTLAGVAARAVERVVAAAALARAAALRARDRRRSLMLPCSRPVGAAAGREPDPAARAARAPRRARHVHAAPRRGRRARLVRRASPSLSSPASSGSATSRC